MWIWWSIAWAEPLTLQAAWEQAMQQNLEIQGQRRANDGSRLQLMEARGSFDPRLSVSAGAGGSQTPTNNVIDGASVITSSNRRWSASIAQSLPTGGSLGVTYSEFTSNSDSANAASNTFANDSMSLTLSQPLLQGAFMGSLQRVGDARLGLELAEVRWRSQLEQLVLDVAEAYWGLLSARERRVIADRGVTLAEEQLAQTKERQAEGFAGSGEVLQVQVSVGQALRSAVDAEAAEGAAALRLARVLGRDLQGTIEIVDRPIVDDTELERDTLLALARQGNAQIQIAHIERERAQRQVRQARNAALPNLDVDADVGFAAGGTDPKVVRSTLFSQPAPSWGVGARVGLPLFLRESRARLGMAAIQAEQAELSLKAAEQDLFLRVDAAVRNVRRDRANLQVATQTLEFAKASLKAQQELLAEGRGATRDVVDALESLRAAEASELDARIACQFSQLAANRVGGTLLSDVEAPQGAGTP